MMRLLVRYCAAPAFILLAVILGTNAPGVAQSSARPRTVSSSDQVSLADFYVSLSGSDRNSGTRAHPWATITHAATMIFPGATVHVAPGVYAAPVETNASGRADARIRYVSDQKWRATILITKRASFAWTNTGAYVDIEGFEVTGNAANGLYNTGAFARISNNHVHHLIPSCDGNGGSGINLSLDAHDGTVTSNVVHHITVLQCDVPHGVGIYIQTASDVVHNNLVYLNGRQGIQMWHGATRGTIVNNTVFSNGREGILIGCGDRGCGFPGPPNNDYTTVANNISVYNECGVREYGATGTHNVYRNNLLYGNVTAFILQNGNVATATLSADPSAVFIDWKADGTGDYRLHAGGPAIARGTWEGPSATATFMRNSTAPPNIGADIPPLQ